MKEIKLSQQGKNKDKYTALIDDEDYGFLNQFRWCIQKNKHTIYVIHNKYRSKGKNEVILMHRLIMNPANDLEIDHIDHNGLNNQKHNLRICTKYQNNLNKIPQGRSKYLGVSITGIGNKRKIIAKIAKNGKQKYLGTFKNEIDAAKAYDNAAKIYHGEFANFNFK